MNQKRMLVYILAMMGMIFILSVGNHPYPGDKLEASPESVIAMGITSANGEISAEDITILDSADVGKEKLYIFEVEGEQWAALATGDIFCMRYDLGYQQLSTEEENVYTVSDHTHKYRYEYVDGQLKCTEEKNSLNDDVIFTAVEVLIIIVMLFGVGRNKKIFKLGRRKK